MARSLTRTSLVVGLTNAAIKPISMLKEICVASLFGTSAVMDQFSIAFGIPALLASLLGNPLGAAFTPVFLRERGAGNGKRFHRQVLALLVIAALVLSALVALFRGQIAALAAPGMGIDGQRGVAAMLLLLAPYLVGLIVGEFQLATLAALSRFVQAISWSVFIPIATIASLYFLHPSASTMCLGLGIGTLLLCGASTWSLSCQGYDGIALPSRDPALREMAKQVPVLMLSTALLQANLFVDRLMASTLPAGSVAALAYSYRLLMLATILFVTPFGQLLLTHFSEQFVAGDWKSLVSTTNRATRSALIVLLPVTTFGIVYALECTRFVYERGAFTPESSRETAMALAAYLPTVLVLGSTFAIPKYFNATQQNTFMLLQTCISLILNIALNLLFMRWWGHVGIAASTSVTILLGRLVLFLRMRALLGTTSALQGLRHLGTLAIGLAVFLLVLLLEPHVLPNASNPLRIAAGFMLTFSLYYLAFLLLRNGDLMELRNAIKAPRS